MLFPAREFVLSQIVFVGISTGAVVAFVLLQRGAGSGSRFDHWLVAPAFGLLAGWVTAAFFIAFVTVLVATGVLSGGIGEALFGALMLIVGGAVACVVILAGSTGPVQGYFAYGGCAVGASRGGRQPVSELLITSSTSIVCALLVGWPPRHRAAPVGRRQGQVSLQGRGSPEGVLRAFARRPFPGGESSGWQERENRGGRSWVTKSGRTWRDRRRTS